MKGSQAQAPTDVPLRDRMLGAIAGWVAVLGLVLVVFPWRGGPRKTLVLPWFVPATNSFLALVAFCVALLAFGRWRVLRDTVSFWIALAFSNFGMGMLFAFVTYPGLLPSGEQILGQLPQAGAWVTIVALELVILLLLASVVVHWPGPSVAQGRRPLWIMLAWLLSSAGANLVMIALEHRLPEMISVGGEFTGLVPVFAVAIVALAAPGAAFGARRYRRERDLLVGYVAICQISLAGAGILFAFGRQRFDLAWFAARLVLVAGFLAVLFGLLSGYVTLYRREREKTLKLRDSEELLRRTQAIAHLGSWDFEPATNRLVWSDETYRIFGMEPRVAGITYREFLSAVHPEDRAALGAAFSESARQDGGCFDMEHRIVRPATGEIRFVHGKCEHVRDEAGQVVRSIGMVHDVTVQRQTEQALRQADERKNEFIAMLSHELRNPLAPIANSLYILERASRDGEQVRRAYAIIERQVNHLSRLVGDLLDVSRITRGKIQLQRERADLRAVISQAVEDHRPLFAHRSIATTYEQPDSPLWAHLD